MRYARPSRLAYVISEASPDHPLVVYLMSLPDGRPRILDGTAAVIWVVAAQGEPDIPDVVASILSVPVEVVAPSTRDFLDYLVAEGLLAADAQTSVGTRDTNG